MYKEKKFLTHNQGEQSVPEDSTTINGTKINNQNVQKKDIL